jgi:hypothetical protein
VVFRDNGVAHIMLKSDQVEAADRARWVNLLVGSLLFIAAGVLVWFALAPRKGTLEVRRVKMEAVAAACRQYAENNDNRIPDMLSQVESYLRQSEAARESYAWAVGAVDLLTPGMRLNPDADVNTIMLRERTVDRKGQRVVARMDGSVVVDSGE